MAPPFGEAAMRASCASSEDSVTPGRRSPKSGTTKPTEASMAIRPCLSSASRSRRTSQMFATPRGSKGLPGAAAPAIVLSVSGAAARIARRRRGRRASLSALGRRRRRIEDSSDVPGKDARGEPDTRSVKKTPEGAASSQDKSSPGPCTMPLPGDQDVDLPRLVAIVSAPYTLLTAACHPLNVMKTRAQASSSTSVSLSRMEQLRVMLGTGGMRGLFSGVGPVLLGAIPARCSYIAALEAIKVPAERAARAMGADGSVASGFAHGAGGFAAAFVSSLVYVPVDVVSQRMMLEGASGSLAQTVREVTSGPRGWRGLYRGLGISLMLGLPAGSLWWATYGSVRTALADEAPSSRGREFAHKAIASTAAAAVVVSVMSPLDMIKTRVQLLTDSADSPFAIAARLIRRDGVASLYSGSMPRLVYLAVWSTMLITIYEEMKVYCVRPRDR